MRFVSVGQSCDDVSEGRERLVDVLGLLEDGALGPGLADLLATGQIDEVELAGELLLVLQVLLLHVDQENGVTARAVLVHV